jgi:hypothetical protein
MDVPELLTGRLLAIINYDETRMSRVIGPGLDGSSFARRTCRMSQTAMMFVGRKIRRAFIYDTINVYIPKFKLVRKDSNVHWRGPGKCT